MLTQVSQQFDLQLYTSAGKVIVKLAVALSHRGGPKSYARVICFCWAGSLVRSLSRRHRTEGHSAIVFE